jgi:hypothetical protein
MRRSQTQIGKKNKTKQKTKQPFFSLTINHYSTTPCVKTISTNSISTVVGLVVGLINNKQRVMELLFIYEFNNEH